MTANLSRRIKQLERKSEPAAELTKEDVALQAARKEFYEFIYREPFVKEFCDKANTLFASMTDEHASIVISDCHTLEQWDHNGEYPKESRITGYFFEMLGEALEGTYVGPLVLPATVCEFWREYKNSYMGTVSTRGVDCEDCGYVVPPFAWFGYKRHSHCDSSPRDYEAMRCPLCNGKVFPDAYSKKYPDRYPGHYNHRELEKMRLAKIPNFSYTGGRVRRTHLMILLARLTTAPGAVM
jgi:hypothetical protein